MVVAKSYAFQGGGTRKVIGEAANAINAEVVEVNDERFPPMALNMLQFADRSIGVTSTETGELENELAIIVGREKVFTTPVPIQLIPEASGGGIRCLTNLVPQIKV